MKPIEASIIAKLTETFEPSHLEVHNESHQHNVPPGSESHFKVVLVCEAFNGKRQVQRHQSIYAALSEELAGPVHALALHTYSPDEWGETQAVPGSPACLGGGREKTN